MTTSIEWVRNPDGSKGETWPVVTGCTPVSEGCRNCYAARMAATRLKHHPRYKGLAVMRAPGLPRWTGEVRLNDDVLEQPLRWKKPRMVFAASMGDLFHRSVSFDYIGLVLNIIYKTPQHVYQLLTKRPERMMRAMEYYSGRYGVLPNVWLGTSIENQATADERIPWLLRTPAAVRFVSVEPMLEAVNITDQPWWDWRYTYDYYKIAYPNAGPPINWIICGGESGPGARVMPTGAASSIIQQCKAAGVPVFMKQLGSVWAKRLGLKSAKGSDMLEWPWDDLKVREYPTKDIIR